ncbi:MAG: hypothetical protein ACR2M7_01035 [Bdellovibrionales bacterium]
MDYEYIFKKICHDHDLVVNNLKITYNIPEGMCRYVHITPPWHYNFETGQGPSTVYECEFQAATGVEDSDDQENYFCAATGSIGAKGTSLPSPPTLPTTAGTYTCNGGADSEIDKTKCATEIEDLCRYNYTISGESVSCCYGTYRNASDESDGEWAGTSGLEQCLGGPGRTSWDHKDNFGFPATLIQPVSEFGVRGYFDVKNLLEATNGRPYSTAPIANYLKALDQDPEDLRDTKRSDLPDFLQIKRNAPSPFFEVKCIDSAGEILHQLQLMVREWNTHEEFLNFYNAGGSEDADPDVSGVEGEDCDYEQRATFNEENGSCNDAVDLNDIIIRKADDNNLPLPLKEFIKYLKDYGFSKNDIDNIINKFIIYPNVLYDIGGSVSGGDSGSGN